MEISNAPGRNHLSIGPHPFNLFGTSTLTLHVRTACLESNARALSKIQSSSWPFTLLTGCGPYGAMVLHMCVVFSWDRLTDPSNCPKPRRTTMCQHLIRRVLCVINTAISPRLADWEGTAITSPGACFRSHPIPHSTLSVHLVSTPEIVPKAGIRFSSLLFRQS